jgi:DNA-binding transcriptional ArsR family regulator/DNA-binding PadR family transcriptional regulator
VREHPEPTGDPDLTVVGALLAEPARAKVLLALADGRELAASVLAAEAGVAASTASHHLARLVDAGLITAAARGRHRYFALAGPQVAELIEAVARIAPPQPITSLRQGTRAHAVRYARRCYDHLAGRLGVAVTDALQEQGVLVVRIRDDGGYTVTEQGADTFAELGIEARCGDVARSCSDWTEQRNHIAGTLGRALMTRLLDLGWLSRDPSTRAMRLTDAGRANLPRRLGVRLP